jgi:6-aminohexanoate-oligomer endohydrolase
MPKASYQALPYVFSRGNASRRPDAPHDVDAAVTNVAFPRELLRQLGRQVHSSMARAIQPFHTPDDGDILFTDSTGEVAAEDIDSTAVGVVASELAWDAVLACFDPNI